MNDFKTQMSFLQRRESTTHIYLSRWNEDLRKRVSETLKLCNHEIFRCDLHSHSTHSDGRYSIDEINTWSEHSGLDLVAVTDHDTLSQTAECNKLPILWSGIEVSAFNHHVVVLSPNDKVFEEYGSLNEMLDTIKNGGGFPFIAHPCGWYRNPYISEAIQEIEKLDDPLVIEIGNGAGNMFNYFDITDAEAVELWDRLLVDGKRVIGLGNTDAHMAYQIGIIWNGILSEIHDSMDVKNAIDKGCLFVSDGPICIVEVDCRRMGDTITSNKEKLDVKVECHDVEGISNLRVIKNGAIIKDEHCNGDKSVKIEFTDKITEDVGYLRAESYSIDNRRAYTNPIFIRKD